MTRKKELLDELLAKIARIAAKAPNNYPDYLIEIGASMENDFARLEEVSAELAERLKQDRDGLVATLEQIRQAKSLYEAGHVEAGMKTLMAIYRQEDQIMKWR